METQTTTQSLVPESPIKRCHSSNILTFFYFLFKYPRKRNYLTIEIVKKIHSTNISWIFIICTVLGARDTVMNKTLRSSLSWRLYSCKGRQWMDGWVNEWIDI